MTSLARGGLALGAATLGWALVEARLPVLRHLDVPVLAPGEETLTILHLADLHLTAHTEARVRWVRELAQASPDVVVNTGDNLSFASGLEPLHRALEPFLDLPGAFVMGDHDYHATTFKLPTRYLRRDPRLKDKPLDEAKVALPWRQVRDLQAGGGWVDLTNTRGQLQVGDRSIELVGVDDAHANRDVYPAPAPPAAPGPGTLRAAGGAPLRLGVMHAPYTRVLDAMVADGVDLALAGHTHGGQLCLPGVGALVTNCDLDRGRASGLSRWPDSPGNGPEMFLHVSAGLGTSPFTPVRTACRPEATLLRLVPAGST